MKNKNYVLAMPDNRRYRGIYYYVGKSGKSVQILYKDKKGRQIRETLGTAEEITLEKAYEIRCDRMGLEPSLETSSHEYEAIAKGGGAKTDDFLRFYFLHKKDYTFHEISFFYLLRVLDTE